jgi:hypothetical protein
MQIGDFCLCYARVVRLGWVHPRYFGPAVGTASQRAMAGSTALTMSGRIVLIVF